jgi:hypothetical protein
MGRGEAGVELGAAARADAAVIETNKAVSVWRGTRFGLRVEFAGFAFGCVGLSWVK